MENNRECYHCPGSHPELAASFMVEDFGFNPEELSEEEAVEAEKRAARCESKMAQWEAMGYPSRAVDHLIGVATNFRTERLVIRGAGESQTLDTKVACKKLLGTLAHKELGDLHFWTHNSWHHFMSDHAVTIYQLPLAPDRTLVRTKWLVHKDAVEGVDYDVDHLTQVWIATNDQDSSLVARAHRGIRNPAYRPGPYSRYTEAYVDQFVSWYVERLQAHGF
jgi:Rieske 2Fe-2S family protein